MDTSTVDLTFAAGLLRLPYSQIWSDYDEGADVLYLSFAKPQCASDHNDRSGKTPICDVSQLCETPVRQ